MPGFAKVKEPAHVIKVGPGSHRGCDAPRQVFCRSAHLSATARGAGRSSRLDQFSQSGLWSINVPKAFGGPEVSYVTLTKVIQIISAADPSIGQIPQNHLGVLAALRTVSDEAQQRLLFGKALEGVRFGNAFSEFGSKRAADFETHFVDAGDHVIVKGRKFYSTGALLAHLVPIVAVDDQGRAWYAIAERDAPGLTVIDDWSAFGQRTTLSGTVILDNVTVPKTHSVPGYKGYDKPTADGAIFQIIQVGVDNGIAKAAIDDTIDFVRTKSRAWVDSGLDRASQDPTRSKPSATSSCACMRQRRCRTELAWPSTALLPTPQPKPLPKRRSRSRKPRFSAPKSRLLRRTSCSSWPALALRWLRTTSIATGATRVRTRCMTRCAGSTRSSATTSSMT